MKTPTFQLPLVALGACGLLAASAHAQGPETATNTSVSHIVEVAPLETTPERIAGLKMPAGFRVTKFAELENPRVILVRSNGDVYVSQRTPGTLTLLKDTNHDGRADVQRVVATRKNLHGLAVQGNTLYFITVRELYKAAIKPDGSLGQPQLLVNDLPDAGQHPNRTLGFGPDGKLYISVGSTTNAANEVNEENATIIRFDVKTKQRKVFATGLRNTIGFSWHPTTKRFWGWDQSIDTLGDDEAKEEINEIKMGKRYGWPFIYEKGKANEHPAPPPGYTIEDWRKMSQNPKLLYTAHAAGMQWVFYTGQQFPAEYRNDAFVTLRGSWNRQPPSGYEIVRIRFDKAGNALAVEPFLDSFLVKDAAPKVPWGHFGRLVGLAQCPDGSMLFGDDTNNTIYRLAYGAKNTPRPNVAALDDRLIASELVKAPTTIRLASNTFKNGDGLPGAATAYDKNISPDLRWAGVPKAAKSLVLMMEDSIARSPKPAIHWLVANIPPTATGLPKNILPNTMPMDAMQGGNLLGKTAYYGPKPPADGLKHQYHFQLFALDTMLKLPVGYNRVALLDAMAGHVLAQGQIVGLFERNPY